MGGVICVVASCRPPVLVLASFVPRVSRIGGTWCARTGPVSGAV